MIGTRFREVAPPSCNHAARENARVLDAGCGTGRMSRYLTERGVWWRESNRPVFEHGRHGTTRPPRPGVHRGFADRSPRSRRTVRRRDSVVLDHPHTARGPGAHRCGGHPSSAAPLATCSSVSSPAKVRGTCLRHTARSVTKSNLSATSTRRIKSLPGSKLPAWERCAAWCDVPRARRGTTRPSCSPRRLESSTRCTSRRATTQLLPTRSCCRCGVARSRVYSPPEGRAGKRLPDSGGCTPSASLRLWPADQCHGAQRR